MFKQERETEQMIAQPKQKKHSMFYYIFEKDLYMSVLGKEKCYTYGVYLKKKRSLIPFCWIWQTYFDLHNYLIFSSEIKLINWNYYIEKFRIHFIIIFVVVDCRLRAVFFAAATRLQLCGLKRFVLRWVAHFNNIKWCLILDFTTGSVCSFYVSHARRAPPHAKGPIYLSYMRVNSHLTCRVVF